MDVTTAISNGSTPSAMADEIIADIDKTFGARSPKGMAVFAAPAIRHADLLATLKRKWPDAAIVGASSSGEFTQDCFGQGYVSVLAIGGDDVAVSATIGHGVAGDPGGAARRLASGFSAADDAPRPYRSALVMADALSGRMDELARDLTVATGGEHKFFGGGAGDNGAFARTSVFCGGDVATDAAVALEIRSSKPIGVGACHGWVPASEPMRVTEAEGVRLVSLDGLPAIAAFEDHAAATGQAFDIAAPMPFFLSNILGIAIGGQYRLRVPLRVNRDGSLRCVGQVPTGALVSIMRTTVANSMEAARRATRAALADLGGHEAGGGLMFDCVGTRVRLDQVAAGEIEAVRGLVPGLPLAGCYTHGQMLRGLGQFAAFQNCTAVVCLLPN